MFKIAVRYQYAKWQWTETYGLGDLLMLLRHLSARTVTSACIIAFGRIVTLL